MKKLYLKTVGVFVVFLFAFGTLTPFAHAALITNTQINEQNRVVLLDVVNVLRSDVKLLQMLLIQKLEARVNYLRSQI